MTTTPRSKTLAIAVTTAVLIWNLPGFVAAQSSSRYEALQRAQSRLQQAPDTEHQPPSARPLSVMEQPARARSTRVARAQRQYVPRQRVAQVAGTQSIYGGGDPIVETQELIIDDGYGDGYSDGYGDVVDGGCDECGSAVGGSYFDCGSCGGRGGCPPGALENCWLAGLGPFLRAGEYGIGVVGFRGPQYSITDQLQRTTIVDDASFGFYGEANFGVPLCRLSCGLLSGQIGVRNVVTEFNGNPWSSDNRNQLFFTGGIYRRVDYGWQMGVVADYLQEEWYTETDLVQIRGDIGWVYPGGCVLGFRFGAGTSTDTTQGIIEGPGGPARFSGLFNDVIDNYRFYYQTNYAGGGYSEFGAGWTEDHAVFNVDFDLPMGEYLALQTGATYFLPGDKAERNQFGGNGDDVWNIYLGMVWRPRGRAWYQNYDRPLFNVADNGSMPIRRQ